MPTCSLKSQSIATVLTKSSPIAAYYTPFKEEGFAATERLLTHVQIPWQIKYQTEKTSVFTLKI